MPWSTPSDRTRAQRHADQCRRSEMPQQELRSRTRQEQARTSRETPRCTVSFLPPIDRVTMPLRIVDQFLGIYFCLVSTVFEFAVPHPDYRTRSKTKNGALLKETKRFIRPPFRGRSYIAIGSEVLSNIEPL